MTPAYSAFDTDKGFGADPAFIAGATEPASRLGPSGFNRGDVECEPMHPDEDWSEWIHPLPGYLMQCCDCSLIHEMEFAIGKTNVKGGPFNDGESDRKGVVLFRARRHLVGDANVR